MDGLVRSKVERNKKNNQTRYRVHASSFMWFCANVWHGHKYENDRPMEDHQPTINISKGLCMIQRTPQIEVECV